MNLALAVYELSGAQPGEEVRVYLFIIHFMLVLNLDWSNYLLVHVSLVHLLILFCLVNVSINHYTLHQRL